MHSRRRHWLLLVLPLQEITSSWTRGQTMLSRSVSTRTRAISILSRTEARSSSTKALALISHRDWVLRLMYRLRTGLGGIAGTQAVFAPGVENEDVSDAVDSHTGYASATGLILQRIGLEVEQEEVRRQTEEAAELRRREEVHGLTIAIVSAGKVSVVAGEDGVVLAFGYSISSTPLTNARAARIC